MGKFAETKEATKRWEKRKQNVGNKSEPTKNNKKLTIKIYKLKTNKNECCYEHKQKGRV